MKIRANKNSLIGVLVAAMVAGPLVSIPAAASGGGGTVSGGSGGSGGGGGGGGGSSGGGGGGGGGTVCDTTPVLPTLAPFPDIILRESFGYGQGVRPAGGNGCNKPYFVHNSIAGFWVEYPGNKNTGWLAPADVETWNVCASGDPDELPSPLQAGTASGGCLISNWADPVITRPTALVPFTPPATAYQMSIEAWPAPVDADYYLGFGLTDNSVLDSNLETSAGVWLELRANAVYATTSTYALRANGRTGPILAWGTTPWSASTHLVLRYDPVTQSVSASVEGVELGSFVQPIKAPRFIGIEGVGQVDNLVVRKLQ